MIVYATMFFKSKLNLHMCKLKLQYHISTPSTLPSLFNNLFLSCVPFTEAAVARLLTLRPLSHCRQSPELQQRQLCYDEKPHVGSKVYKVWCVYILRWYCRRYPERMPFDFDGCAHSNLTESFWMMEEVRTVTCSGTTQTTTMVT